MKMFKQWIALFSHTGSEIYKVSQAINRYPDVVLCNKRSRKGISSDLLNSPADIKFIPNKPSVNVYREYFNRPGCIVTLHGYMRILPKSICNEYQVYNLHPGLITKYPSLKGADPQIKAFKKNHKTVGCIIDKAEAEVDSGDVYMTRSCQNTFETPDDLTYYLHSIATDMWVDFLQPRLELAELSKC